MTAPKRMALALGCVLLALSSFVLMGAITSLRYGWRHALPDLDMAVVWLLFALPGWLLALPFVLLFKDAEGWRTWATLAIGIAIGPGFMLGWSLLDTQGRLNWEADGAAVFMSVWIGTVTTVLYVLSLRHFGRRRASAQD